MPKNIPFVSQNLISLTLSLQIDRCVCNYCTHAIKKLIKERIQTLKSIKTT